MSARGPAGALDAAPAPSRFAVWAMAARPRTLSLSVAPVAVGAALAYATAGVARWPAVALAALAAALIQIGTNLHNDASDGARGADGPTRIGPPRVTALGFVSAAEVGRAAFACFAAAAAAGVGLVALGGWPILALGVASLICGWAYSAGPRPIAYTPLGEIFVIAFFGLAAVGGTYWLACGAFGASPIVAGLAVGGFAAAVLLVNNHRDRVEDARAGRRTLAILAGPRSTAVLYAGLMLAPFLAIEPLARLAPGLDARLAYLALPLALAMTARFRREPPGRGFNAILALTALTQAAFAALLCLGAAL